MKYLLSFILIASIMHGYGQNISGTVIDKTTQQPVSGALVSIGNSKTYTNTSGKFEIANATWNDSLKIVHFAYKTYTAVISKMVVTLHIELEQTVISLNTVTVHGNRDFKKDSIKNRIAYARQFNYKGPTVMDAFTGNPNKQPGELISINPLLLIAVLTKKSTPEYKFNKILIRNEQADYVDRKFNRGIVSRITYLRSDTLSEFLIRYRPTYQFAKKATDYDMEVYIKESFEKFKREGFTGSNPFHNASNKNAEPVKLN
jgi:hypothetical protein